MSLNCEHEVANTRAKLARLEARYEALRDEVNGNRRVRDLSMISIKRLINQFKEEIARYEAHSDPGLGARRVLNESELVNTRRKLSELERRYTAHEREIDGDLNVRELSMGSLKRLINQLKEEIIWTEVHQPARRETARS